MIYYDFLKLSENLYNDIKLNTRDEVIDFLCEAEYENIERKKDKNEQKETYIKKIVFDLDAEDNDSNNKLIEEEELISKEIFKEYVIKKN